MSLKGLLFVLMSLLLFQAMAEKRGYKAWKNDHKSKVRISDDEDVFRNIIYEENVRKIDKHNEDPDRSWEEGENQFTGLTQEEFRLIYLNAIVPQDLRGLTIQVTDDDQDKAPKAKGNDGIIANALAAEINWATVGGVSSVKDQGSCGSCWAFATVGSIEASYMIKNGVETDLSEQQLVSCSGKYGNSGCNGGWPASALRYVLDNKITTESEYPYTARTGSCNTGVASKGLFSIAKVEELPDGKCGLLRNQLQKGPITVTVAAGDWGRYKGGVMKCTDKDINHAVLLVGYDSKKRWIIKNSWGNGWGEKGYMRIAKGVASNCEICTYGGAAAVL